MAVGSIFIARLLGPEDYGLYSLSLVIPSMLLGLMDLGISPALTRFSAKHRAEGKNDLAASILRTGFFFKLLGGVSMSAVCFVFSNSLAAHILNRPEMSSLVRFASPLILIGALLEASYSVFIGLDRMRNNALVMNIHAIVKTASSPLLIVVGFGVVGALIGHISGYAVASFIASLILFKIYRSLGKPSNNGLSSSLKVMLSYGLPLYISALISLFLGQYKNIILAFYASNTEIGNFNVAATLSSTINILVFPLSVLFPAFTKVNPGSDDLKKLFNISVKYTSLLIIPSSILVAITSKELVHTFYGQRYDSAPLFLSLYILTFLYSGLGSMVLGYLLNGLGETKTIFKANLITAAATIPLAPALTILKGVPGLIIALLISSLPSLAYQIYVAAKNFNLTIDINSSLRICLASLLSAIPLLIFLQLSPLSSLFNLAIGATIFLLTFLTIVPLTKAITREDLTNLQTILKNMKAIRSLAKIVIDYEEAILNLTAKSNSCK